MFDKMNDSDKFSLQIGIVLVVALILMVGSVLLDSYQSNLACEEIGFDKKGINGDISNCVDIDGNIHFVEFSGFFKMKAKEISVGDVRTITG